MDRRFTHLEVRAEVRLVVLRQMADDLLELAIELLLRRDGGALGLQDGNAQRQSDQPGDRGRGSG